MEKFFLLFFLITSILSWVVHLIVASIMEDKGYEVSHVFIFDFFKKVKKLSNTDRSFVFYYYILIITSILPFAILFTFAFYLFSKYG